MTEKELDFLWLIKKPADREKNFYERLEAWFFNKPMPKAIYENDG